jgi:poly-gamma-glutamate capsule biosynthesis protein CapA/YwtB (metallophosphatase superfamily)
MLIRLLVCGILIFTSCSLKKIEEAESSNTKDVGSEEVKILFVGDLLLDRGVRDRIDHAGIESLFSTSVDSVFSGNDFVIANLECPATTIEEPINKKYIFRAEPNWLGSLNNHGITHLNLANNHSMDQGRDGLIDTDKNIKQAGMISLGYGKNVKDACSPYLISSNPRNIYLLSSLQVPSENWTFFENKPCVCENSMKHIESQVQTLKAEDENCIVIIQLHWGVEHVVIPNLSQKQAVVGLVDAGADCIIGHHPHVVQTVEIINGVPVFYSIGNFIFDQKKQINSRGLMIQLAVQDSDFKTDTIPFVIENCVPKIKD